MPRVQVEAKLHPLLAGAGETERTGLFDQFGNTFDTLFGLTSGNEITKAPDDLPGADGLFGGAVQRTQQLLTQAQRTSQALEKGHRPSGKAKPGPRRISAQQAGPAEISR